jgi:long-chain acyl-CoA synthetase
MYCSTVGNDGSRRAHYTTRLIDATDSGKNNLWEVFLHGMERANAVPDFLGRQVDGRYEFITYRQVRDNTITLVRALDFLGYKIQEKIGIFSVNSPEWVIVDLTCNAGNYVSVPMYPTLNDESLIHIINQTEMRCIFTTGDKSSRLLNIIQQGSARSLELIVVMDDTATDEPELHSDLDVVVVNMRTFIKTSVEKEDSFRYGDIAHHEDVATICYTSGTTGLPKGVILTHGNILAELAALSEAANRGCLFDARVDDYHISYLPLSHIFERVMVAFITNAGGKIGFYRNAGATTEERASALLDDIARLKPTIFVSVPRVYNRIYNKILSTVERKGTITRMLFERAVKKKTTNLKTKGVVTHPFWDSVVFSTIKESLGGRVRIMVTGSAPIASQVVDFLRIAFGVEFYEGYGQTETTAALSATLKHEVEGGNVGVPIPCCEVKLVDVADMGYFTTDKPFPRGEIYARGNQVFPGYYKDHQKTVESFASDGWYKTGDIGMWDSKGRLVVVDRLKCIFKLAQGEYVAPEKVENCMTTFCDLVANILVTGDSLHDYPVAIVVPKHVEGKSLNKEYKDEILKEMSNVGRSNGLKGYEIPRQVTLVEEFPDHLWTPTYKLKRNVARNHFADQVQSLYREEDEASTARSATYLPS